jgi:hypothetical protein
MYRAGKQSQKKHIRGFIIFFPTNPSLRLAPIQMLNEHNMPPKHDCFLSLTDALAELNRERLAHDANASCYAPSTAYGYAAAGRIPAERRGRAYFVRRSDLPVVAARLPLGGRARAPSAA